MENNLDSICKQFGQILNGEGKTKGNSCSVSLNRTFKMQMQGKDASSSLEVTVAFQDLDHQGNAINYTEVALLQEEVPAYVHALMQQGIIVGAIHNHWLYTDPPQIMYVHCQSVEPPIQFAHKMAFALSQLKSPPSSS